MKVLYFHQHFSTPKGAAGIRSYEMAQRLIARGHSVTMVCGSYGGGATGLEGEFAKGRRRGEVDGIDIIELDLAYSNNDSFLQRAMTFLRFALVSVLIAFRESYDVVFATTTPLTAGIPGVLARWIRGKPFVFEVRDLWPELPRAMGVISNPVILWAMSVLEWVSYRSAHRCIGLSPGIVDGIARRGVKRDKIALIPNGCDLDIFASEVQPWRPEGIAADDLLAIFAGTQGNANGLDAVLDVAGVLKQRGRTDIKILLMGRGALHEHLVTRAKAEQLENVVFHEPVPKAELAGVMAATDVGLQVLANVPAFYYGTSPNKFFDYLAAGLPVLNNYPGWLAGMIEEHQCGFVVPPENAEAFADALEEAADNKVGLQPMGENARGLARSDFDRQQLADKFVCWLEGVVCSSVREKN